MTPLQVTDIPLVASFTQLRTLNDESCATKCSLFCLTHSRVAACRPALVYDHDPRSAAWVKACCRAASVLPPWNSRCKIELIFGVMLQFNIVWCIHSRREIVLTIQSDNGKQGYKVGGKKYCRPKVVLSRQPWRPIWHRLDSETGGILSSQRGVKAPRPKARVVSCAARLPVSCNRRLCLHFLAAHTLWNYLHVFTMLA